jgi:hypothetical protein
LGGHSLLATQLMSRVREAFGVEVALRALFERPTVRGLAAWVEEEARAGRGVSMPALQRVEHGEEEREGDGRPGLPLSFAQQRLWFLDQLEPGNAFYNCPAAVRMSGGLDVDALERTLTEVVRRHEVLRTRFPASDGLAVQVVEEAREVRLPVVDVSELGAERCEREARRLARAEAGRPFNLSEGPLWRAMLVRMWEGESALLFTTHHIVSDAWSKSVLVREVAALYEAFSNGRPSPLPELPIQYSDYAVWQRNWLQGDALEEHLTYWRRQLGGELPVLKLPTDRPRPAALQYRGAHDTFLLSESLTAGLKELSRVAGTTLYMTLMAAFNVLLHRYTGDEDILVGTVVAGRNRGETENLIGFFINTLVLRTDLSGSPKFTELLAQVKDVALGAYAHQDLAFDKLVEELQPERTLSRAPIVQVTFGLQNAPKNHLELQGLTLSGLEFERETGRYDVTLWMSETESGLRGVWTYLTELYDLDTIKRMTGHFETLLASIVEQPEARLNVLEMFTEAEKEKLSKEKSQLKSSNLKKFKSFVRKAVG